MLHYWRDWRRLGLDLAQPEMSWKHITDWTVPEHSWRITTFIGDLPSKNRVMRFILIASIFLVFSCQNAGNQNQEVAVLKAQTGDYDPEAKLKEMGIELPEAGSPVANYVNAVRVGNTLFLSGKGPKQANGEYITGKVGVDLTVEQGYEAAKLTGIQQLAVLKAELGNLNKVKRIVKVLGMVNCAPDYGNQPEVVNGFSDLMVAVFGERGKHARSAVGMGSLPRNIATEIEVIVEVE